jgi:hypothetical protein
VPAVESNASPIAGQTSAERSMFPWTLTFSAARSPAWGIQLVPVCAAVTPCTSTNATWRIARLSSAASSSSSASRGSRPSASSASPRGP